MLTDLERDALRIEGLRIYALLCLEMAGKTPVMTNYSPILRPVMEKFFKDEAVKAETEAQEREARFVKDRDASPEWKTYQAAIEKIKAGRAVKQAGKPSGKSAGATA